MKTNLIFLFFAFLWLYSCVEDECEKREYRAIKDTVVNNIPYSNNQLIRFKTSEGDTFTTIAIRNFEVQRPDQPFVCLEYMEVILKHNGSPYPFAENYQWGAGFSHIDSMVQFTVRPRRKNGEGGGFQFVIKKDGTLKGLFFGAGYDIFHQTIILNGKQYSDVLELNHPEIESPSGIVRVFYNKEFGIIQLTAKDGFVVDRIN